MTGRQIYELRHESEIQAHAWEPGSTRWDKLYGHDRSLVRQIDLGVNKALVKRMQIR